MVRMFGLLIVLLFIGCDSTFNCKYIVAQDSMRFYTDSVTKLNDNCIVVDNNVTVCGTYTITENPAYRGK